MPSCWLASLPGAGACDGRLVRCHLLPRQLLRRELGPKLGTVAANDPRSWVWGCGGPMGASGHHGALDYSRSLRVPREVLPVAVEALAAELDAEHGTMLVAWLAREYGPTVT